MVSGEPVVVAVEEERPTSMKEMIGGCCVCSDERGWAENPLVYCDGHGCNVAVHQACYGIVQVPTGPWFCRKCESQERAARVRCELCPHKDGALKRTDNGGWAHVVCALYIPEVQFANVSTMEPIVLQSVPHERYNKTCYICDEQGRESKAATGACMTCNKHGCRQAFHVTCAQLAGLLCEEEGNGADNVQYCGYCKYHYSKLKHKEKEKHRQKSRKQMEPLPSLVTSLSVTSEKAYTCSSNNNSNPVTSSVKRIEDTAARFTNANFQEVSAHPITVKEALEARSSEMKVKKAASHSTIQRGRKSSSGRNCAVSSTATSPFQQGLCNCNDVPTSFPSASSGSSTPVSSSHFPQPAAAHLQQGVTSSPSSSATVPASTAATQVSSLPGSTLAISSSHTFGSRLNPTSAAGPLPGPNENNQSDQDAADNNYNLPAKGASPKGSLSPRSPLNSVSLENIPPVATSIEQLLERQWSEGQQFLQEQGTNSDLLGMLKSLHQLQVENRRLEEQIKNLLAKKERLQLLNAQLSVPFPTISSNPNTSPQVHTYSLQNASNSDSLHISKSPHLGNFQMDNALPVPNQERTSSGQSTSSCSSLSTPPPDGQSPAQQVQGVQRINGVAMGALASGIQTVTQSLPHVASVGAIIGALPANQLSINFGALNGVMQNPANLPQTSALTHGSILPNVTHPITSSLTNSASGLGLLSDQQRQLLLHQQQQQFQHILNSQQLTPEQHHTFLYHLMQQHHQQQQHHQPELQQLQIPGAAQLPLNSLLAGAQAAPLHSTTTNPFLALHRDATAQKVARLGDKPGPLLQDKS
ncbi:protein AF-10 isoform X10 [Xenopus laevis]|uniref:Protein AF-10 isoform X10 n=1 Tax=Xenopus laevis TaxID=8355 RepID=A0A8J0VLV9_XENLA|nr:protein AF-10 isoform X10 [Xenopus laevis]